MKQLLKDGQYLSIEKPIDFEINIKRSRFIASLRKISNRLEFEENLKIINAKYSKANHYCWAYRFYGNPIPEHASDAGEPAGSAGRPILGTLKKNHLLNIMAVVTRYYGGIKLGISGLIFAYREVTANAILNSEIIVQERMTSCEFVCSYEMYKLILDILKRQKITSKNVEAKFGEMIFGKFNVPLKENTIIIKKFDELKYRGYLEYRIDSF